MKFTTIIPTQRNDGTSVSQSELDSVLQSLWQQFGGLTVDGTTEGHWVDQQTGQHYFDPGLKVTVVCDRDRIQEARDAVITIGKQLDQIEMYFEVQFFDGVEFLRIDN